MATKKGTRGNGVSFERVLGLVGDDPETMIALIVLCDRIIARRNPRRKGKKSTRRR